MRKIVVIQNGQKLLVTVPSDEETQEEYFRRIEAEKNVYLSSSKQEPSKESQKNSS